MRGGERGMQKMRTRATQNLESYAMEQSFDNKKQDTMGYEYLQQKYGKYVDLGPELDYRQQMVQMQRDRKKAGLSQRRNPETTQNLTDISTDEEENAKKEGGKEKLKGEKMQKYKSTLQTVTKVSFLVCSILLIAVAALRFTVIQMQSAHEAILNFYFLFFGVIVALQQLGLKFIKRNFRFLNYYWGKAIFCSFIAFASLSNGQNQIVQYVNAAVFFLIAILEAILALCDRKSDQKRYVQDDLDRQDFLLKKSFRENAGLYYVKHKQDQVKETFMSAKRALDTVSGINRALDGGKSAKYEQEPYYYEDSHLQEDSNMMTPSYQKQTRIQRHY